MTAPLKFAAIADIHGNADALRVVLDDIAALGIALVVNLGDHFSGPLDAAGTWALLSGRPMISIRGNHDRWLIEQHPEDMSASDRCAYDQLPPEALDWIRSLPGTLNPDDVFLCHGTPGDDTRYWVETVTDNGQIVARSLSEIEAEATGADARLILCAHTHQPRVTSLSDGRLLVNPGSVGCPAYKDDNPVPHAMQTGSALACYAILEQTQQGWSVTHRRLPYDTGRMVALANQAGHPEWARAIATGFV